MKSDAINYINEIMVKAGTADCYMRTDAGTRMLLWGHEKRRHKWSEPIKDVPALLKDMEPDSIRVVGFDVKKDFGVIREEIRFIIDVKQAVTAPVIPATWDIPRDPENPIVKFTDAILEYRSRTGTPISKITDEIMENYRKQG